MVGSRGTRRGLLLDIWIYSSAMASSTAEPIKITVAGDTRVSGLVLAPGRARAGYVFAHGAGAGMAHPFMARVATGLAARGIATLRYQFAYMAGA
jgi:hypothetical protein